MTLSLPSWFALTSSLLHILTKYLARSLLYAIIFLWNSTSNEIWNYWFSSVFIFFGYITKYQRLPPNFNRRIIQVCKPLSVAVKLKDSNNTTGYALHLNEGKSFYKANKGFRWWRCQSVMIRMNISFLTSVQYYSYVSLVLQAGENSSKRQHMQHITAWKICYS